MTIRPATEADWAQIWPFFREIVADGETYAYPEELTSEQARALWFGQQHAVVLEEDGAILGSATWVRTARGVVATSAPGRSWSPRRRAAAAWGAGWGSASSTGTASRGTEASSSTPSWRPMRAAVRLWQSLGFRIVGTVPGAFHSRRHGYVGLHVMYLDLG